MSKRKAPRKAPRQSRKKAEQMEALTEIVTVATVLQSFPKLAIDYQVARDRCARLWEHARRLAETTKRTKREQREQQSNIARAEQTAEHEQQLTNSMRGACLEFRVHLGRLHRLVSKHLPELDGDLRAIVARPAALEEMPIDTWADDLDAELRRVMSVASRRNDELDELRPKGRRGNKPKPLEEYIERVRYYKRFGPKPTMDQYKCSASAISRWKDKLRAAGINLDDVK